MKNPSSRAASAVGVRQTALVSAIAGTVAVIAAHAVADSIPTNVEVGGGVSDDHAVLITRVLRPFSQTDLTLWYGDARWNQDFDASTNETNLGVGYRRLSDDYGRIWGGYLAWDYVNSDFNENYSLTTLGFEMLSLTWDFRANAHIALDNSKVVDVAPLMQNGQFAGTRLEVDSAVLHEEALTGVEAEIGRALPTGDFPGELRLYVGAHRYQGDIAPSNTGYFARTEYHPTQNFTLGLRHDAESGEYPDQTRFEVRYSFGYTSSSKPRTLDYRMWEFHDRGTGAKLSSELPAAEMTERGRLVIADNVVHIDNTAAAGGDGSFERPYNSFASCAAGRCNDGDSGANARDRATGELVYVHAGDGSASGYNTPVALEARQRLIGQGYNLAGIGGDAAPKIMVAGNAIKLAQDNEVAGFNINASGDGIYGPGLPGAYSIHDNQIVAGGRGIAFTSFALADNTANAFSADIRNNQIRAGDTAIFLADTGATGSRARLTRGITIADNELTAGAAGQGTGIAIGGITATGGAQVDDRIAISDNVITSFKDGVVVGNIGASGAGSTLTRDLTITANTLDVPGRGIALGSTAAQAGGQVTDRVGIDHNLAGSLGGNLSYGAALADGKSSTADDAAGSRLSRRLTIADNTLRSPTAANAGLTTGTVASSAGGAIEDQIEVRGNTIGAAGDGIVIGANSANSRDSSTGQTLNIADNTIAAGARGIALGADTASAGGTLISTVNITHNNRAADILGTSVHIGALRADGEAVDIDVIDPNTGDEKDFYTGSRIVRNVTLDDNSLKANAGAVLQADTVTASGGGKVSDTLTVTDNDIAAGAGDGVALGALAASQARSGIVQTVDIKDNQITAGNRGVAGAGSSAVGGGGISTLTTITGNTLTTGGSGVHYGVAAGTGAPPPDPRAIPAPDVSSMVRGVTVADNTIVTNNASGAAVQIDGANISAGAVGTDSTNIARNQITTAGDGIAIGASTASGKDSALTRIDTLSTNTIDADRRGVVVDRIAAEDGAETIHTIRLDGNNIDAQGAGIGLQGAAAAGAANTTTSARLTRTATLTNNTVNTASPGIAVLATDAGDGGIVTDTLVITGNTITVANGAAAVGVGGSATGVGSAQTITFNNNTVGGAANGITIVNGGALVQQSTLSGNRVSATNTGVVLNGTATQTTTLTTNTITAPTEVDNVGAGTCTKDGGSC